MLKIGVVGGDQRLNHAALALARAGYPVGRFCAGEGGAPLAELKEYEAVLLPAPLCADSQTLYAPLAKESYATQTVFDRIAKRSPAFCGMPGQLQKMQAHERKIELYDLLAREEYAVYNAEATAEGAVGIALLELPITLYGATCLIAGFGRIGKELLRLLRAFGVKVYVAARKEADFAWISLLGGIPISYEEIGGVAKEVSLLYNTVPAPVLSRERISLFSRDCLMVELASAPGGFDLEETRGLGFFTVKALSLPGKYAPKSAGELIARTVESCLFERGMLCERKLK